MTSASKFEIFIKSYVQKKSELLLLAVKALFLILVFSVFERPIERFLKKYWVKGILDNIPSIETCIVLACLLALYYSFLLIKRKRFSVSPLEIFIIYLYLKYRFFDPYWIFTPEFTSLKYIDILPAFLIIPKLLALKAFIGDLNLKPDQQEVIDPDLPLSSGNENDLLGRSKFAAELVEVLTKTRPNKRSLVIGINGSWGSGKSSLQYLVSKQIWQLPNTPFYLVSFNPWFYANTKSLTETFLHLVSKEIEADQYMVSRSIDEYAKQLVSTGERLAFSTSILSEFQRSPSIEEQLHQLKDRIQKLKKTLIITIDDLDRLSADELIEVLRLVRLAGDFPNTIYLLLYDRQYVTRVVEENLNEHNSQSYIDKIIQVEYSLPEYRFEGLCQLLQTNFEAMLKNAIPGSTTHWSSQMLDELIKPDLISPFFKNLRDIKRFTNNFILRYRSIYENVNFKQFFLLEIIRFKYPEIVSSIFSNQALFIAQMLKGEQSFHIPDTPVRNSFWNILIGKEEVQRVLQHMTKFSNESNSMTEVFYFPNYFTLAVLDNFIYTESFNAICEGKLNDQAKKQYDSWITTSRENLFYHFRLYDGLDSSEKFLNYVTHLVYVQNTIVTKDKVSSDDSWSKLPSTFINQYLKLVNVISDSQTFYLNVSTYILDEKNQVPHEFQKIFKDNTRYIVKVDYDNPIANGWKVATGHSIDHLGSIFSLKETSERGKYLQFDAPFNFRFDYQLPTSVPHLRSLALELMLYEKEWAFYLVLNAAKGTSFQTLYFRILAGDKERVDKVSDDEFSITLIPKLIKDWRRFELEVNEAFRRSFSTEGFELKGISGIAVRGKIAIGNFELT